MAACWVALIASLVALRASAVGVPDQEAGVAVVSRQAMLTSINTNNTPIRCRLDFSSFDPFSILKDLQAGH